VTRNTTATRFTSAGLLESVASGIPRLDYYTSGGVTGCPALLVEPSAVNLALHSRDLTNAVWSGTNITTAKNAVGADGVASGATTLTATAASGTVLQAISHASQSRVFSAYVRRVTGTGAIQMTTNNGTTWTTVTISSLYTQVACAAQTVASGTVGFRMAVSGDVIEVDFTQGEVGPAFTSPIPTTAGTGSRSADVISVTGAVSGSIGQTEGTLYAEVDLTTKLGGLNGDFVAEVSFDANTKLLIRRQDGSTLFEQTFRVGGTNVFSRQLLNLAPGIHKFALAYKTGNNNVYVDGSSVLTGAASGGLTNTFTITNAMNRVDLGHSSLVANTQFKDRIRALALYTTRLTDAELATLTTL
jgi:hypothetical protein